MLGHEASRGQCRPVGGAVVQMHIDFVTEDLPIQVPHHRMAIHVDNGVGLAQLERVTDALHVTAVKTHLIEGPKHTHRVVHRVIDHMVDERAQGIGMQVDGILL